MKVCISCKESKDLTLFYKCSKHKDGLSYKCKACSAEYLRQYKILNRDKFNKKRNHTLKLQRLGIYDREQDKNNIKIAQQKHREYCEENKRTLTKKCNKCLVSKTLVEFDKGNKEKDGFQPTCKPCNRKIGKQYREENPKKVKLRHQVYQKNNPEKNAKRVKNWRDKNPDRVKEITRKSYLKNKESENKRNREYHRINKDRISLIKKQWRLGNLEHRKRYDDKYRRSHIGAVSAKNAKRRAIKKQAYVSWADNEKIKLIYLECARLSKETGIAHHVDHIIPLQSKYVCGLHVETNLQILPWYENLAKNNKFTPG